MSDVAITNTFGALMLLCAAFVLGTWYGLYLNLTHWHRMRRWACNASDVLNDLRERSQ